MYNEYCHFYINYILENVKIGHKCGHYDSKTIFILLKTLKNQLVTLIEKSPFMGFWILFRADIKIWQNMVKYI